MANAAAGFDAPMTHLPCRAMNRTVAGALVIAVIQYGLVFVNVEPFWQFISVGVVIIISVLIDQAQRRFSGGRVDE